MENNNELSVNINKYISSTGLCSRREAEKLITEGKVLINNVPAQLGNRVFENDKVTINGKPLLKKIPTLYIAFNKPIGIVSTTDSKERKNIIKYINHPERLFPIGRLDKPSEGLIFLTNDGDIVNKILRAGNNHEKVYEVTVSKVINTDFIQKMSNGIPILGTVTKKCVVEKLSDFTFKIILTQGLNRQIRRMCDYLNYEVIALKRTRIMNVSLGNLKSGEWRELTYNEIKEIKNLVKSSSKTEEASEDKNKQHFNQNKAKQYTPQTKRFSKKSNRSNQN